MSDKPDLARANRIVVVGGVAGGMSAAARARRLDEGAQIIVLEKGEHVSFANCGLPYFVGGEISRPESLLVQTPKSLAASLALDVRTRHEVIGLDGQAKTVTVRGPDDTYNISFDHLILSPGAAAIRPPLPGIELDHVQTLRTVADAVSLRERAVGGARSAAVLGAGFIGLEAAEALAMRGLAVSVVERAPHVLPPLESELASLVARELGELGIDVLAGRSAAAIEPGTVVLEDGSRVAADIVVLAVGVRPDTAVFESAGVACDRGAIVVDEHGRTSIPGVWAVGDATASVDPVTGVRRPVPLAGPANRAGRLVADAIARPEQARAIPASIGTAIIRVGELTAAITGTNRDQLDLAGIAYSTIHLHANHHAGYFPGAQHVHMVVHFRTDDGVLLGAQAVGREGVDKRIDIIATALRAHLRVDDLIDLDLAYSPPYGQAKDPVNLAGMVGENVLTGRLKLWHAHDLEDAVTSALVLDVRTVAEFEAVHLAGSMHVPHTQLRERLDDVRAAAGDRPVRVVCQSGVRSAIAHRILAQAGFDSASLSGGMLTLLASLPSATLDHVLVTPQHSNA